MFRHHEFMANFFFTRILNLDIFCHAIVKLRCSTWKVDPETIRMNLPKDCCYPEIWGLLWDLAHFGHKAHKDEFPTNILPSITGVNKSTPRPSDLTNYNLTSSIFAQVIYCQRSAFENTFFSTTHSNYIWGQNCILNVEQHNESDAILDWLMLKLVT